MRIVYLDEGGTSRLESPAVVAGVIVNGDTQLIPVEEHLERLVAKHIPEEHRDGFVFHATNIWSGTKFFRDDKLWPLDRRLEILDDLVQIPNKFEMPIVFGYCPRNELVTVPPDTVLNEAGRDIIVHAVAFAECAFLIEKVMREAWPEEAAILIAEDRARVKQTIREVHSWMRNGNIPRQGMAIEYMPLTHIRDTVHWAKKMESRHLQLADICTFVIRGHLNNHPHNALLYNQIRPMMIAYPKSDDQ